MRAGARPGYSRGMRLSALLSGLCVLMMSVACTSAGGGGSTSEGSSGGAASTSGAETSGGASTGDQPTGAGSSSGAAESSGGEPPEPAQITVLDKVVFYDGYAATVDEPLPAGVVRHNNALLATRFTDEQLAAIQSTLKIGVIIGALCDNYDRIGGVNLALVPKGAATYVPAEVQRIELARFITPFMDMNQEPKSVVYQYSADNVVPILKDPELLAQFDVWFELSVFGVPYAANNEIAGCAGRTDTQQGTLLLYSDSSKPAQEFSELLPLAISESFNNYAEGASDMVGTTRKTIAFALPADSEAAQLVLITSNHGANEGGEEYIRREHFVYVDGEQVLQYKPGRTSCEPFRPYNTQGNGIYGPSARSDEEWQSFSNWCPGDVIDTRIVPLGAVKAGAHEFVIDVPDATFAGMQGDFPLSLYVQAK